MTNLHLRVTSFVVPPFGGKTVILILSVILFVVSSSYAEREWPFYVPKDVSPPALESDWIRNDIDRFVLEKLQSKKLEPAARASKRTLVRRLYFDLIGLPPSPEDIWKFLDDESEDAYSKLVDRLLDDSRYGEKWARFWLDLARYADTAGYEGDPDLPHAWRYRDYVIDAFNKDKPYDLFIREQLAGDEFQEIMGAGELPETPAERVVAMTFLRLAPFTEPRGDETRHEMLSEITSTVGSVFLGLTVGCAKCHDHKHDDIPTADFYRMKAFFSTVQIPPPERGDAYQIGGSLGADFYRDGEKQRIAATRESLLREKNTAGERLAKLKDQIRRRIDISDGAGAGFGIQAMAGGNDYIFDRKDVHDGKPHMAVITCDGNEWKIFVDGTSNGTGSLSGGNSGKWFGSLGSPQHVSIGQHTGGSGKPSGSEHVGKFAELMIFEKPLGEAEQASLSEYFAAKYGDDADRVRKEIVPPKAGLQFWLDASDIEGGARKNPADGVAVEKWVDKVSGIALEQSNEKLRPKMSRLGNSAAVEFSNSFLSSSLGKAAFKANKQGAIVVIFSATHSHEGYGFEVGGRTESDHRQFITTFVNPAATKKGDDPIERLLASNDPRITMQERREFEYLSTRDRFTKQHLKRLKPVAMSLRHSFGPPYEPGVPTSRVMIRGEYNHPGEVVEAGFLSVITGNQKPAHIRLDPFKRWPTRSRRMALAKWIASRDNPMTGRVMVNRLWHEHFGQGIVRTTSDFGDISGGPSHQELLDWLAIKFVDNEWSVKSIHRLILNSATYMQTSSREDAAAKEIDPDNRLLWRFSRQRMTAEAVRDNVLAISGRLNPKQYGLPIFPPLPGEIAEAVKYDSSKWDTQYGAEGRRRSLYIYQQRTLTMPMMQAFDNLVCDESRPRRRTSVTALQALAMYNGEFVNDEAKHFADRVREECDSPADQISTAFEISLGRLPNAVEKETLDQLAEKDGLKSVCRVLMNTNEFIHVD